MDTEFDWLGLKKKTNPAVSFSAASVGTMPQAQPVPVPRYHSSENVSHIEHPPMNGTHSSSFLSPNAHYQENTIPLSLTAQELTLAESKTYMRWYSDILLRTNAATITMNDVFSFFNNFRLTAEIRDKISQIFAKIAYSINIGEFFAVLRVISHALCGQEPRRQLIKVTAPVPSPPSILSKKRHNEESDGEGAQPDGKPLDIDSFSQFILTGERPEEKKGRKKQKSVKFSDQIVTHDEMVSQSPTPQPVDYSRLSMDQLLKMQQQSSSPQPEQPELLQPNMTGPAQMAEYLNHDHKLLQPNMTGPAQMAKLPPPPQENAPKISLASFTSQMTGATQENTIHNADMASQFNQQHSSFFQEQQSRPTLAWHDQSQQHQQHQQQQSHQQWPETQQAPLAWPNTSPQPSAPQWPDVQQYRPPPPMARQRSMSSPLQGDFQGGLVPPPRTQQSRTPPPPPPRRRNVSYSDPSAAPPALPPKIELQSHLNYYAPPPQQQLFQSESTSNILDDLKALEEEVNKIRDMTGGF